MSLITLSKLQVYVSYDGDGDRFARSGRPNEREILSDEDWLLIDLLIQDATVINRNLGSENRTDQATRRLRENTDGEDVVEEIKRLAERI